MKQSSLRAGILLAAGMLTFGSYAQQIEETHDHSSHSHLNYESVAGPNGFTRCMSMENQLLMQEKHPGLPTLDQYETWLQGKIAEYKEEQAQAKNSGEQKATLLTIPVVVHVIHNGDAVGSNENISDGQILSQIQVLNEDYRRMMGTNGHNTHPDGADVEIEFCMAVVDPNGNPTNGIDRVNEGIASFSGLNDVNAIKPNSIWNPDDYMNMWVVNYGNSGLLGFATFPASSGLPGVPSPTNPANEQGVVADYRSFGSSQIFPSGTYNAPYDLGRTMTHEVGHFLGLRHIWGDAMCGNDFCADTPESQSDNYGCPTQTTCDGNQDMVENYMDYTNDACMNIFTEDQKTRMRTVMQNSPQRSTLPNSTACQSSSSTDDVGVSNIVSPDGDICGTSVTPEVVVTNYGNNTVTSFDLIYNIDGSGSTTYNWSGSLAVGATTTITLGSMTTTNGSHTFNANTNNPNGTTDSNTGNDSGSSNFTITVGGELVTLTINTDCYGEETVWELYDDQGGLVGTGGNTNVTLPVTATQNTQSTDPGAYPAETQIDIEWCLSAGCYDFTIWDAYGDGMNGSAVTGCTTDGDYSITDGTGATLVSMQAANGAFNFSETQNFCVSSSGAGINEAMANAYFSVYPNPSKGLFNVEMAEGTDAFGIKVIDVAGRVVFEQADITTNEFQVNLNNAADGSYTMIVETESFRIMKRIILKK